MSPSSNKFEILLHFPAGEMSPLWLLLLLVPLLCDGSALSPKENEQLQKTCGHLNGSLPISVGRAKRSTNGVRSNHEDAPWLAAIGIGVSDIYCSAVWISDRHLLTAAHCVSAVFSIRDLIFKPYVINTRNTNDSEWQWEPVEAFQIQMVHYPWIYWAKTPGTFGDIALVEVIPAKDFVPISKPVCLPSADISLTTVVTMYGYGSDLSDAKTNGSALGVLRSILGTTTLCPIHGVFSICFNGFPFLACHGDSGGPIISVNNGRREVNGIMSTINHLCQRHVVNDAFLGYMNTGTNVNYHTDWICHASGVCPTEALRNIVKDLDGAVRAKYRSFGVEELERLQLKEKA